MSETKQKSAPAAEQVKGCCMRCHKPTDRWVTVGYVCEDCGAPSPAQRCPHCGSGLLWSEDRGAHCDGCDDYNEEKPVEASVEVASFLTAIVNSERDFFLPNGSRLQAAAVNLLDALATTSSPSEDTKRIEWIIEQAAKHGEVRIDVGHCRGMKHDTVRAAIDAAMSSSSVTRGQLPNS